MSHPYTARLPLTAAQAGVWAAHQLDPSERRFTIGEYLEIPEPIDPATLAEAWRITVSECQALQVHAIGEDETGLWQLVDPASAPPCAHLDFSTLPDPEAAARAWLRADLDHRADLSFGPLSSATLLQLGERRFWFYHRYHHVVADGIGYSLVLGRLAAVHRALRAGQPVGDSPFSPLAVLVEEDAAYRTSAQYEEDRRYWTERLADRPMPARLTRRTLRTEPPADLLAWERAQRIRTEAVFSAATMQSVRAAARRGRTSWLTVLIAVTAAYLRRMTGQDDILLALPVAARTTAASRRTPAMVTNTVTLRLDVPAGATLDGLLPAVDAEIRAALAHQRFRHEDLLAELGLSGSDVGFLGAMANLMSHNPSLSFGDLPIVPTNLSSGPAPDLTFSVQDRGDGGEGAKLAFDANPGHFDREELLGHRDRFLRLAEAALAAPGTPIGDLELLGADERQRLLVDWNDTAADNEAVCLPALFERAAAEHPDAVAVSQDGSFLTYRQLDEVSAELAGRLAARGIGPEDYVAVAVPRSPLSIAATLAVLRAGAAYLPIDTGYPVERIAQMVEDAAPALVLTTAEAADRLPADAPRLLLDTASDGTVAPVRAADPANPAYLIYTSGSTGRPKGVAVPHQGIVNLVLDHVHRLRTGPGSRVTQLLSPGFDAAVQEIWPCLASGAELVLPPRDGVPVGADLADWLADRRATHMTLPPVLLTAMPEAHLPDLRSIVVGGDTTEPEVIRRWAPGRELRNHYGPTEMSCTVSGSDPLTGDELPPIGRPIRNTRLHVLDDALAFVPAGVTGELYATGAGIARGYLGRPGQTAERFLPCPYGPPGSRMYRTGDLVRRRPDGRLDFLGRADGQVKVRGYRIELGEIEAVLAAVDEVADVVVTAHGTRPQDRKLVAYVTAADGRDLDPIALRAHLARILPDFMVPAGIVVLAELPVTPNGKVDRKALPAPDFDSQTSARAARNPREQLLCELFAEVLGVAAVGVDESFFDRGGDSILAIQLVARARQSGLRLSAGEVMRHRTPEELATVARSDDQATAEADGAGIGPVERTPITGWLADLAGDVRAVTGFNQSVVLRTPANADPATLAAALQALTDHHDALRISLAEDWTPSVRPVGAVTVKVRQALSGADRRAEAAAARDRLDPRGGSVLEAVLFDGGELLVVAHHLAVDGVSWRILLADLATAWAALATGARPVLPPVATSLRTWAGRLAATAPQRRTELPAWQAIEATPDPGSADLPAGPLHQLTRTVPPALAARLLTDLPATLKAGVDELLLTALATAVPTWRTERTHPAVPGAAVLIDLESHGRQEGAVGSPAVDLSRTVGWFTAVHPVALRADPAGDRARSVKLVKDQLRAVPGDGLGHGLLKQLDGADGLGGVTPELAFNYLGRFPAGTGADWEMLPGDGPLVDGFDPRMPAAHALEITVIAYDRADGPELRLTFGWPVDRFTEAEAARLADLWLAELAALPSHAPGLVPTDVPLVGLDQARLEALEAAHPGLSDVLPLTPLQEGFLFHTLIDGRESDAYLTQLVLDLDGPLDPVALRTAARRLLDRHPALRAGFVHEGLPHPVQVVREGLELPWSEGDVSALPAGEREAELERLTAAEKDRPFDLAVPPLLRVLLLRSGERSHRLVLTNHHILWDGWSTPVLLGELFALLGGAEPGPARPVGEYLGWLAGQDVPAAREAWTAAMAGLFEPTHLVPDAAHTDPVPQRQLRVELPEEFTARLTGRLRSLGVTVSTLVEAAWGVFLARTTGADDVVFGTSVSGRDAELPGVERMVGMLTNTLPVRVALRPEETLAELLVRLQDEQNALTPHHHLGLAEIQRAAGLGPLFDTTTVCLNYPLDLAALEPLLPAGLRLTGLDARDGTHYPLRMAVIPGPRLRLWLGHRPDCYPEEEAEQLLARFRRLLEAFADSPDTPVGEIDILTAEERMRLLVSWGGYGD
ncbi:amino acid adenylation domain-containing protein [Kitasatospora sp. NPDC048365]|uniref:amino acid adenylation domain-containing protein n=1 Tax=Kitasatospora sp. NPDC048365 TaxID=3364050 RepID=UPI003724A292